MKAMKVMKKKAAMKAMKVMKKKAAMKAMKPVPVIVHAFSAMTVMKKQAPPSKMLRTLQSSFADARASLHQAGKNNYFQHVLKLHEKLHGNGPTRIRRAERRDAGASREPASGRLGPETEAAFGRKRKAASADVARSVSWRRPK